jgi:branched-subunit amino acid transport protein
MSTWLAIAAAGVACFALRLLPAGFARDRELSARTAAALAFVGPAAMAAIAAPSVVLAPSTAAPLVARLMAIAVALPVARSTRSPAATVAVGMSTLWLVTAVTGA